VKRELEMQRILIKEQLHSLDDLAKHLSNKISQTREWALDKIEIVPEIEEWRWLIGLCKYAISLEFYHVF